MVELAALLHDIGKIGTPESILHKSEKLKPEEFEKIKEHPIQGAEILSSIEEFNEIIKWIKHHHEWYNGNGYPDGLSGEDIPLHAAIISVADAFDAMTSMRPYRVSRSQEEAIKEISRCAGSQFDPRLVDVFLRIVKRLKIHAEEEFMRS